MRDEPWQKTTRTARCSRYVFYLLVYTHVEWITNKLTPNMYRVPEHMVVGSVYFYICIFAVPHPGAV